MTSLNRPARLNRVALFLLGLISLAAGGFALATHFGRLRVVDPSAPLVTGTAAPPTWALYVTAGTAVVLGLLMLRWMLAQLSPRPRTRAWRFDTEPIHGRTELAADVAVAPFTAELRTYPGVHTARATLAGTREEPTLALVVSVTQDGDPTTIRERLDLDGLPRLRQALDLDDLPVVLEFRFTTGVGPRIR
ncbi:alkaline shock response membrane anchor protein AmaP [Amycolatopsis sp. cmx-4-83]|uniref:alkaline shock response membrane anchor protein AmaP n=1 Tax=Amycolatopsis sp. cmx-4-83 TaxID=2790940 RepID=UPI00397DB32E